MTWKKGLLQALGEPKIIVLPAGHYTASFFMPYVRFGIYDFQGISIPSGLKFIVGAPKEVSAFIIGMIDMGCGAKQLFTWVMEKSESNKRGGRRR